MANKEIKGISIQIGADTTPLDKALSDINSKAVKTQTELTKVNKLLKFDPKNTELLAQKQQLLTNQISNTKEKLDKLKSAEAEVQDQFKKGKITEEQYRAYQREIQETTNKLKYYEDQLKETGRQTSTFAQKIDLASEKLSKIGSKMTSVGKGLTASVTAPILAIGGASMKAFSEVDSALDTVVTKTGATGKALESMQNSVKKIATDMPTDFEEVGNAVGEVNTQFGLMDGKLEKATEQVIKFSQINGQDVTSSTISAKGAIEAYGLKTKDLGSVLDAVTKTAQNTGVATDKIFDSVTKGAPQLKALGLDFAQSAQLMGGFEQKGIDSSKALSYLSKAQVTFAKDGKTLDTGLAELSVKLQNSKSETDNLTLASEYFGTKGATFMLDAIQRGALDLDGLQNSAKNASGAVSKTFDSTLDPIDKFKMSMNSIKTTLAEIAVPLQQTLEPVLKKVTAHFKSISEKFEKLSPQAKEAIVKIGLIAMAIGPLLIVGGKMAMGISKIIQLGTLLAPVIAGISWPVVAVIAVVAALIAIGVLLYKNWDKIMEKAHELKEKVSEKFEEIKGKIHEVCNNIAEKWEDFKQKTAEKFQHIKQAIIQPFTDAKQNVIEKVEALKNSLSEKWESIKSTAKEKFESVKSFIVDPINRAKEIVAEKLEDIKNFFSNLKLSEIKIPKIKLPHFKLEGEFSLKNMTVPKLSITWNAQGAIFTKPYIFGNQGVGEAGPEAVLPISKLAGIMADTLNKMQVKNSVVVKVINEQEQMANKRLESNQKQIITMLERYLPEYLNALDISVVLDDKTLVGKLTPKVDSRLGTSYKRKARGNV